MIRLIAFLVAVLALAAGFSWLADRPGEVSIVWLGWSLRPTMVHVAVAIVALVIATIFLWSLVTGLMRTPQSVGSFFTRRRREKGWNALSRGMIAVGAGDPREAARLSAEARRILGDEPLALLLDAQSAQAQGDFAAARTTFEKMLETPETRLLGLRGLYVEASREGEVEAARHFAEEANTAAPKLAWAGEALITFQAGASDWEAALVTLERNQRAKVIDKPEAKRLRAVLLTARGLDLEQGNPDVARGLALEAHGLAPQLVPAALLAARLLVRAGDVRKASRVLEAAWREEPHPDVAEAYARVRPGDAVKDRLARIRDLIRVRGHHPECALALARAELAARDFIAARASLKPLLEAGATRRTCLLMAEIDEAEFGASSKVREWLTRAVRAPRDPAWVADGHVFEDWAPVSPVSGRLDAFVWTVPPERGTSDNSDVVDRLAEDRPAPASVPAPVAAVEPAAFAAPRSAPAPAPPPAAFGSATLAIPRPDDPGPAAADITGQEPRYRVVPG